MSIPYWGIYIGYSYKRDQTAKAVNKRKKLASTPPYSTTVFRPFFLIFHIHLVYGLYFLDSKTFEWFLPRFGFSKQSVESLTPLFRSQPTSNSPVFVASMFQTYQDPGTCYQVYCYHLDRDAIDSCSDSYHNLLTGPVTALHPAGNSSQYDPETN